jgi:NAD(P)-dependent dehydrogenase (short-subunit alcohol dehydrogenase family)
MSVMLAGRHVLIAGGAKGIGAATVVRFMAEGARVAILDRDASAMKALGARSGASLFGAVADVSNPRTVAEAVAACARELGALDGVVNAAGIDLVADIEAMSIEAWDQVLGVNLRGPMLVMRACYPHLKAAGGGTIVNVSSGAGLLPLQNRTAYCASKAGLQMLSKALAMEGAQFKIRVNAVCPGAVETDLFRKGLEETPDPQAAYEAVRTRYALRRIAGAEEIAAAILWLTSTESSFVTGAAIAVDGGRTFH